MFAVRVFGVTLYVLGLGLVEFNTASTHTVCPAHRHLQQEEDASVWNDFGLWSSVSFLMISGPRFSFLLYVTALGLETKKKIEEDNAFTVKAVPMKD